MKQKIIAFVNNPIQVAGASVLVALIVGVLIWRLTNSVPALVFATAGPGTISLSGTITDSGAEHLTLSFLAAGEVATVRVMVGQSVHVGDVLAELKADSTQGALTQAQAALATAQANYQKLLNGASSPQIDAAKAAVATAQTDLDQTQKNQDTLVANARRKLYSDGLAAAPSANTPSADPAPAVSGSYNGDQSGTYTLYFPDGNDLLFKRIHFMGLETGTADMKIAPQPLGTDGLSISFSQMPQYVQDQWTITIPNLSGANYATNLNAYQAAVQTHDQTIAAAQAALNQAQSNLNVVVAAARPEDIAAAQAQVQSAEGALQIAEAAYGNRLITAPGDAVVTAIHITPGQDVAANSSAIELTGTSFTKDVAILVPNSAIISSDGRTYVEVKTGAGVAQRAVTTGIADAQHTEIVSGLTAGDQVALEQ